MWIPFYKSATTCLSINAPTMFYRDRSALEPIRQEWNSYTGRYLYIQMTPYFSKHISFVSLGVPVKSSAVILFSCRSKTEALLIWQGKWWKSSYSWKNATHVIQIRRWYFMKESLTGHAFQNCDTIYMYARMLVYISDARTLPCILSLTIIPWTCVGYEMVDSQRGA